MLSSQYSGQLGNQKTRDSSSHASARQHRTIVSRVATGHQQHCTLSILFFGRILMLFISFSICFWVTCIASASTKCEVQVHDRCSDPSNRSGLPEMQLYKAPSSFRNVSTAWESEDGVLGELAIGRYNGRNTGESDIFGIHVKLGIFFSL